MNDYRPFYERVQADHADIVAGLHLTIDEWAQKRNYDDLELYEFLVVHPEWDKEGLHDIITAKIDQLKHSFGD